MRRPNILWYCTDQQRFDTLGFLGNAHIHTPRLDNFAGRATTFTHAYCQSPICTPSRASFLTGVYPSALAVNGNGYADFPQHLESRLLPHQFAKAGYDCGLVGKLHLASPALGQEPRVDDGYRFFQYSHDHKGPQDRGHDYAAWLNAEGVRRGDDHPAFTASDILGQREVNDPKQYREGAKLKSFGGLYRPSSDSDNVAPDLHQSGWCTDQAIEFIDANRQADAPWFLSVNPFDPHPPFDAPWEYFRRYDENTLPGAHFKSGDLEYQQTLVDAGIDFQSMPTHPDALNHKALQASYYAMIEQLDDHFGRLLDYLDAIGEREHTIVIFTSDHGESLGDHGMLLKGCRFFEGLVRVPLMIAWPEHIAGGTVRDDLVELIDLAPTLYEAAQMPLPFYLQGQSLLPLMTGHSQQTRQAVRTEFFGAINYPDQTHATMYRDARWKLVSYHGKQLFELFDLENDPWEHDNLASDPAYHRVLNELVSKSFDATVYSHPPMPERTQAF